MLILDKKLADAAEIKVELIGGKLQLSQVVEPAVLLDKLKGHGGVEDAIIDIVKLVLVQLEK
jgi:hypothetical protein